MTITITATIIRFRSIVIAVATTVSTGRQSPSLPIQSSSRSSGGSSGGMGILGLLFFLFLQFDGFVAEDFKIVWFLILEKILFL